jgi:hypothetical protein
MARLRRTREPRFTADLPTVKISRLRALGVITADMNELTTR